MFRKIYIKKDMMICLDGRNSLYSKKTPEISYYRSSLIVSLHVSERIRRVGRPPPVDSLCGVSGR